MFDKLSLLFNLFHSRPEFRRTFFPLKMPCLYQGILGLPYSYFLIKKIMHYALLSNYKRALIFKTLQSKLGVSVNTCLSFCQLYDQSLFLLSRIILVMGVYIFTIKDIFIQIILLPSCIISYLFNYFDIAFSWKLQQICSF